MPVHSSRKYLSHPNSKTSRARARFTCGVVLWRRLPVGYVGRLCPNCITIYGSLRRQTGKHLILTVEREFWRCVESGETPSLFAAEPPTPLLEAYASSKEFLQHWAEIAGIFARTRAAYVEQSGP